MPTVGSERNRLSRRTKALILSPAVVLVASGVRLIVIANYDTTTATTIASSSGVAGTLLGTIVPLLPPYLPVLVIALLVWRSYAVLLMAFIATAFVSPFRGSVAFRNSWSDVLSAGERIQHGQWSALWATSKFGVLVGLVAFVIALIDPPHWMRIPHWSVVHTFRQSPRSFTVWQSSPCARQRFLPLQGSSPFRWTNRLSPQRFGARRSNRVASPSATARAPLGTP